MVQIKFKFELKFKNVLSSVRTLVLEKVEKIEKVRILSAKVLSCASLGAATTVLACPKWG